MTVSDHYSVYSDKLKQAISRVLSLMTINLVPMLPTESSGLPGGLKSGSLYSSLFSLSPSGVYHASPITQRAVGSYIKPKSAPPFHPYPMRSPFCFLMRRYIFCGTFLGITPTLRYRALHPVELGLSSS